MKCILLVEHSFNVGINYPTIGRKILYQERLHDLSSV